MHVPLLHARSRQIISVSLAQDGPSYSHDVSTISPWATNSLSYSSSYSILGSYVRSEFGHVSDHLSVTLLELQQWQCTWTRISNTTQSWGGSSRMPR